MQQKENNTVTFDEALIMVITFVAFATLIFYILALITYKREEVVETTMIVTKIDTSKTALDKPEYFIQCNNDSILTYRSHIPYKIGETFKIQ